MSVSPQRCEMPVTRPAANPSHESVSRPGRPASALEATGDLYTRARAGDRHAWDDLIGRYDGMLRRYARGRLPASARELTDTSDVVQDAVIGVWRRLDQFEFRHQGALSAYLRQAVQNRIIDATRRAARRPVALELSDGHADPGESPLERAIGIDNHRRYRAALARLTRRDRCAIVLRLEHRLAYDELATRLGMPSPNAARVALVRALQRLAAVMTD
jgi:RNA polymerase sigma factor (sigma-70 family)